MLLTLSSLAFLFRLARFLSQSFPKAFGTWVIPVNWWVFLDGVIGFGHGFVTHGVLCVLKTPAFVEDLLCDTHCELWEV